jgi:hypothetical protein
MKEKKEIANELKQISPLLAQLKERKEIIQIPKDYFTSFSDNLFTEINIESPILAQIPKEKPLLPDGYFDSFSKEIILKIRNEEVEINTGSLGKNQRNSMGQLMAMFKNIAVAAAVIGIIFIIKEIQTPSLPSTDYNNTLASLTQEEIYNYMNEHSIEFDLFDVQQAVKPALDQQIKEEANINMSEDEMDAYLKEHNHLIEVDDLSTSIF